IFFLSRTVKSNNEFPALAGRREGCRLSTPGLPLVSLLRSEANSTGKLIKSLLISLQKMIESVLQFLSCPVTSEAAGENRPAAASCVLCAVVLAYPTARSVPASAPHRSGLRYAYE